MPDRDHEPSCAAALRRARRFAAGELVPAEVTAMRAHHDGCASCRDEYRSSFMPAARLGHERRIARVTDEKRERHERFVRNVFLVPRHAHTRLHRLRTLLYPAFFAFLMFQFPRIQGGPPAVSVVRVTGDVVAGAAGWLEGSEPRQLARGDWCATAPDSSARLTAQGACIVVQGATRVGVERARPPRFRLDAGVLTIDGSCFVTTEAGVVELLEAEARVRLDADGLDLFLEAGEALLTDSSGSRRVVAGEVARTAR